MYVPENHVPITISQSMSLLQIKNLSLSFHTENQKNRVLDEISFSLEKNEVLGIVGESGSGKSVTALSILGLLGKTGKLESGEINFQGQNLFSLSEKNLKQIRGKEISMIFQEPMSSLNPSMKCGKQVSEIMLRHKKINSEAAKKETLSLFEKVKLPRPKSIYNA